jgi:hypothetical protein
VYVPPVYNDSTRKELRRIIQVGASHFANGKPLRCLKLKRDLHHKATMRLILLCALACWICAAHVGACLICPDRDTSATMYRGAAVMRLRAGRALPSGAATKQHDLDQCMLREKCGTYDTSYSTPASTVSLRACICVLTCHCEVQCRSHPSGAACNLLCVNDHMKQSCGTLKA